MAKRPESASPAAEDAAEIIKHRLRNDLKSAMQARVKVDTSVLRALIAALDNAQAVPMGDAHVRCVERAFGDPATEVSRVCLSGEEVQQLLQREIVSRQEAAGQLEQLGRADRAAELREEARIVARYLVG